MADRVNNTQELRLGLAESLNGTHPPKSNTGVSSSKTGKNESKELTAKGTEREVGGVDYLSITAGVHFSEAAWEILLDGLRVAKERAENSKDGVQPYETVAGDEVGVLAYSIGQGIRCKFGIVWSGITIGIKDKRQFTPEQPNCIIQIPSDCLMELGHLGAWDEVKALIAGMGGEVIYANVSRIDMCADLCGVTVADFEELAKTGCLVKRARSGGSWFEGNYEDKTGLELGKETKLRIYDKALEAGKKGGDKLRLMIEKRSG
jgi:hypothetical protein